jgi:hypothetical protein
MGLISGLLTLPLAPVRGVAWVGEQVAAEADRELDDEGRIRDDLARLQTDFELGKLDETEFEQLEDELLEQLALVRETREDGEERDAW